MSKSHIHNGKNKELPVATNNGQAVAFVTLDDKGMKNPEILRQAAQAIEAYGGFSRGSRDRYKDIDTNTSIRNSFSRRDYEYVRPEEAIPKKDKGIIADSMSAYRRVGIVRNIIDLMSDFGSQGIQLVHSNPVHQKFFNSWFKMVNGPERSERFLNYLYRCGNVFVQRSTAKLNIKDRKLLQSLGAVNKDNKIENDDQRFSVLTTNKYVIPSKYLFLHPLSLVPLNKELAQLTGKVAYGIELGRKLKRIIKDPQTQSDKEIVKSLPAEIVREVKKGATVIPLNNNRLISFHYKKDDWQVFADPFIYAILDDLLLLEKMKLADLAALDGAISQIRLWKLGDLETKLFPTDTAITKLANILLSNPGGGAFDIIWGPELQMEEFRTNVHQFLGNEKYVPVLNSIHSGLGVPPTLTGSSNAAGQTNNYISLKTLIKRLDYGRMMLTSFWNEEIRLVQKAMGYKLPAKVQFDRMVLTDESAEKALLLQLADRNYVSFDTILERFGEIPELEQLRMKKNAKDRATQKLANKAGPWDDPDHEYALTKIALQRMLISPQDAGLDVPDYYDGQSPSIALYKNSSQSGDIKEQGGQPQVGRPINSKTSVMNNKASAHIDNVANMFTMMNWARDTMSTIGDYIGEGFLEKYNKPNFRSLSADQAKEFELYKFGILADLKPFTKINEQVVYNTLGNVKISSNATKIIAKLSSYITNKFGRDVTIDELRNIYSIAFFMLKG